MPSNRYYKNLFNRPIRDKKAYKKSEGKCRLCGEGTYATLDIHRIIPGAKHGKYKKANVVCLCSVCHRKIHADLIKIDGWYPSTAGLVLRYFDEDGNEQFS